MFGDGDALDEDDGWMDGWIEVRLACMENVPWKWIHLTLWQHSSSLTYVSVLRKQTNLGGSKKKARLTNTSHRLRSSV
jgi:hypothetical protein